MSNAEFLKVLLPMIRKIVPDLIASELASVQPMTAGPTGKLQTREEPHNMYPYIAQRHQSMWDLGFEGKDLVAMKEWCTEAFSSNSWHYNQGNFYFRNEADRTMFMMRWS